MDFVHLRRARQLADERIRIASTELAAVAPNDVSVVMFGSWARRELTPGSDNDWAILTPQGHENDDDVKQLAVACRASFNESGRAPGVQDVFGLPFPWSPLACSGSSSPSR